MSTSVSPLFKKSSADKAGALVTAPLNFVKFDPQNPGDTESKVSLRDYQSVSYIAQINLDFDKDTGTYSPAKAYTDEITPDMKITPPASDNYLPQVEIALVVCKNGHMALSWENAEQLTQKIDDAEINARRKLENLSKHSSNALKSILNSGRRILTSPVTLPVKSADGDADMNLTIRDYRNISRIEQTGQTSRIYMEDGRDFQTSLSVERLHRLIDIAQGEAYSKNVKLEKNVDYSNRGPAPLPKQQPEKNGPQVDVAVLS